MSTIITAAILLLITAGLIGGFVLLHKRKLAKRSKARIDMLHRAGENLGLIFSGQEIMEKNLIGLDGIKQVLVIIEYGTPDTIRSIRMADVATCILHKEFEKVNTGTEKKEKTELLQRSVELVFTFKESPGTYTVNFYDSYVNHFLEKSALEVKARQWESLLSKMIVGRKQTVNI